MRILIAPQELKGTLTAVEAAEAIRSGVRRALPDATLEVAPIADGGPGTVEALRSGRGGERRFARVRDPLERPVEAEWALLADGSAAIEMAAASGLLRVAEDDRDPLRASTHGTGELIRAALDAGCTTLWIGLGGSATTDGGAGAAEALGVRLLDARGVALPPGGAALRGLARVERDGLDPRLRDPSVRLIGLTDVTNPLLGADGAAEIYGPQKGADAAAVAALEAGLHRLTEVIGGDGARLPGAGAAGGLGFGLVALLGAELSPGFAAVADALDLQAKLDAADHVLTAEGRLDAQTGRGKGPAALAALARGRPTTLFTGAMAADADPSPFAAVIRMAAPASGSGLREHARGILEESAAAWARALR